MSPVIHNFLQLDAMPLAAGLLAAVLCGLLGNFLILRKLSLMGDAISHSVLPGLVAAFLITHSRSPGPMFIGAAAAGLVTVGLVEVLRKIGRIETGAAMGVVFSLLFALGVLLIEQASIPGVDLDPDCVLYGELSTIFWFPPDTWSGFLSLHTLGQVPRQVVTLLVMAVLATGFVVVLFKELRLAAFDPALATAQGFHAGFMHFLLMLFVAAATVASFEAVGSILVIAMLICPAATARLLTDRLRPQVVVSVGIASAAAVLGYLGANALPAALGRPWSLNSAGGMTVAAGGLFLAAALFAPRHGVIGRWVRLRRLAGTVAMEDVLAALYRRREGAAGALTMAEVAALVGHGAARRGVRLAEATGLIHRGERVVLTEAGEVAARDLVRRHRLWESYLVTEAGVAPDHVHDTAERLEHLEVRPEGDSATDPHGRRIPSQDDRR